MKPHLPKSLRAALMGLAASVSPLALTVATASSMAVLFSIASAAEVIVNVASGDNIEATPTLANGDTLTVNVAASAADTTTWGTQIPGNVSVGAVVNVGSSAHLTVAKVVNAPERAVFAKGNGKTQEINLEENSTLTTSVSLAGWQGGDAATVVNMKDGSTWNIQSGIKDACEYMNETIINMENATINIASGKFLRVERNDDGHNAINVYENSGTSRITGQGAIRLQNHRLNFGVATDESGAAENDPATTPTLSIEVAINGAHGIQKTGNSILELTSAASNYSGGTTVDGGTLRLAGEGGKAGTGAITVAADATLELAHSVDCTITNAMTVNGNLLVSGGKNETVTSGLTSNGKITLTNDSTLTLGGTVTIASQIDNAAGTLVLEDGVVLNTIVGSGDRFTYVAGYGEENADSEFKSMIATNTENVTVNGSITHGFSNVIFQTGSTLVIGDGQTVTTAPNIAAGASITLEVGAGHTGTWNAAAQPTGTGSVTSVEIGSGGKLTAHQGANNQFCAFNHQTNASVSITLAATTNVDKPTTLETYGSIFGWDNTSPSETTQRIVDMGAGSQWKLHAMYNGNDTTKGDIWFNKATIELDHAKISIDNDAKVAIERFTNTFRTMADSAGQSTISGGEIVLKPQNDQSNTKLVFDVARSTALEGSSTADLLVSSKITGATRNNIEKNGTGILELTAANTFTKAIDVNGGTLRLSSTNGTNGTAGTGAITVAAGATLELAHTQDCTTANNITLTGNLLVSGSANETVTSIITERGNLTVSSGTLTLSGNSAVSLNSISVAQGATMIIANTKTSETGGVNVMGTIHNEGTLTVEGAIIITDFSHLSVYGDGSNYSEGKNGTYTGGAEVSVVEGTLGGGGTITIGSDTINVSDITGATGSGTHNFTWHSDTGVLTYSVAGATASDTTYHVNTGTVIYGDNANGAASTDITGIELNGGNLTLNVGLTDNAKHGADGTGGTGIVVQQAATVEIGDGVTLAQADLTAHAATLLDGSGTYALGETATSLGNNVSLAEGWTGSVSGLRGNMNLYDYCNSNSSVTYAGNQTVGTINSEGGTIKETTGLSIGTLNTRSGTLVFDGTTATVTGTFDMRGGGAAFSGNIKLVNGSTLTSGAQSGIWGNVRRDPNDEAIPAITVDSTSTFTENSFTIQGIASNTVAEIVLQDDQHRVNQAVSIKNAAITSAITTEQTLSSQLANSNVKHSGSGTLTISGDLSKGNGEMSVTGGGTMKISALSTKNNTFTRLSTNHASANLVLDGNRAYTTTTLYTSAEGDNNVTSVTINAGSSLHVTGKILSVGDASFKLANAGGTANLNVYGAFTSDAGFSVRDGHGHINIKNGGTVRLNKGLAFTHNQNWSSGHINIEDGGTLELCNTASNAPDQYLYINFANGATLAAGEENGTTTVNFGSATVTYGTNDAPATINLSAGAGKTLVIASAITPEGINLVGEGTKTLSADATVNTVNVREGDLAISSGATLTVGSISSNYRDEDNGQTTFSATVDSAMTARANSAKGGTARNVTITTTNSEQDGTVTKNVTIAASGSSAATSTSGEGGALQALGEMSGLTLAFAAENTAAEISNVTLQDVTLNATGGTVTYTNAKAVAATAGPAVAPVLYAATATEMPETLTAMDVQQGGTAKGTLTIDVTHDLLRANAGEDFKWTIFDGVSSVAGENFTLKLGDILKTIVDNGKPTVTLSGDWVSPNESGENSLVLTSGNLVNLHTGTGGLLAGSVTSGNLVLTIENVPEPTTGTLSVLALAALAARRRRRK